MIQQDDNYVKILFRFFSNILDEWTIETMWAQIVDKDKGLYKIDSIPFYAPVASGDIIFAEYDNAEQRLIYRETVEPSGSSTIQVVIVDKAILTNNIRDIFTAFGCSSEKFREGYFVLEVPADKDYKPIKQKLSELESKGVLDYAEPVLSNNQWY
jgi:hypothetical protein